MSAAYGAGGSVVGPELAHRLGIAFHDRAIPATVSAELGVDLETVLVHDGRAPRGLDRLLAAAARMPNTALGGMESYPSTSRQVDETLVAERTSTLLRAIADKDGGVILGRGAAAVLAGPPHTLHVRLDGPPEARVRQAMRLRGLAEATAQSRRRDNDAAREAYVKRLYGKNPRDVGLYHVMLDSTALPLDVCVDILAAAVERRVHPRT